MLVTKPKPSISWELSYGWFVPAHNGKPCPKAMANGTVFTNALLVGLTGAFLTKCEPILLPTPIWNSCCWIAPSFELIRVRPVHPILLRLKNPNPIKRWDAVGVVSVPKFILSWMGWATLWTLF